MPRRLPLVLFCAALLAFAAAFQPRQHVELAVGTDAAAPFLDNFYDAERGYRWTQAQSTLWLSGLGGGNQAWQGAIRLSGSRPGTNAGPSITVSVNGTPVVSAIATNAERDYPFTIAPGQLGANGDARIDIESQTFKPANDPRELGVRVSRVWLEPQDGPALPSLKILLMAMSLAVSLIVLGAAWRPARPAWRSLVEPCLIAGAVVLAAAAAGVLLDRVMTAWLLSPAWLGALALAVAAVLVAWIAPRAALGARRWRLALLVFALAALVRLVFDTGRGYEGDVAIYMSLAWKTVSYGIHMAYVTIGEVPPPNTPPFLLYPFALIGWLYRELFSPSFPPTWIADPALLRFLMRWPALLADLLAGALILRATYRADDRHWWLPAALYLFNPALIFDSAYWGQTAAIHSLWMLLAVIAMTRGKAGWAGALLALAVTTKPQALAIAPPLALMAWRERGLARFVLAGAAAWLATVVPFLIGGTLDGVIAQYAQTAQYHPYLSVNAHNLWWLVTGGQGWQPDGNVLAGVPYRVWGFALFGLATVLSLAVVWRERAALDLAAAYQSLAFFMLLTQIHENHALTLFAPLALACAGDVAELRAPPRLSVSGTKPLTSASWWLYGALALTALANMALHDPALVQALGYPAEEIYGGPALAVPRLINAAAQTVLFAWLTARMLARLRSGYSATAGRGYN